MCYTTASNKTWADTNIKTTNTSSIAIGEMYMQTCILDVSKDWESKRTLL